MTYKDATLEGVRELCEMRPLSDAEYDRLADDRMEEDRWCPGLNLQYPEQFTPRGYANYCFDQMLSREMQGSPDDIAHYVWLCNLHDGLELPPGQLELVAGLVTELIRRE